MRKIAIIGSGGMGRALGDALTRAGHEVSVGSRNPDDIRLGELRSLVSLARPEVAMQDADFVILALPFPEVVRFVGVHRSLLVERTVIDPSNPFDYLSDDHRGSTEVLADALGKRDSIVAAFKDNSAASFLGPSREPSLAESVKLAADDPIAMARVAQLVRDIGHHPIDCGPLHNSRLLDAAASLRLEIARRVDSPRTVFC